MMSLTDLFTVINKINRKSIKLIIPLGIIALIFFPVIDKAFFFQQRINFKLEVLSKLSNIKQDELNSGTEKKLYESTIQDIEDYISVKQYNINIIDNIKNNMPKFLSGVSFWILVFVLLLFNKDLKIFARIGSLIATIIIGMFFGAIGTYIPIIINPIINYIAYPILQVLFIISAFNIPIRKRNAS